MAGRNRKYTAFWALFMTSSVLLVFDKLNGAQYVQLIVFVFGLYMGGNVGEHFSKKYNVKPSV